jgi:hypothetical protein
MPFPVTLPATSPPTPLPAPENASTALALGERCEPETSSRSHVQVAPSAHRLRHRPEAKLAPHLRIGLADGIGSGRERPSPRFGSHRVSRNALPLTARLRGWRHADTSVDTNRERQWCGLRGARAVP